MDIYVNQHYTFAPGAFVMHALSTVDTSTATGRGSSACWSSTMSRRKKVSERAIANIETVKSYTAYSIHQNITCRFRLGLPHRTPIWHCNNWYRYQLVIDVGSSLVSVSRYKLCAYY